MGEPKNRSSSVPFWVYPYFAGVSLFGIGHDLNVERENVLGPKTVIVALAWPLAIPYVLGHFVAEIRYQPLPAANTQETSNV